MFALKELSYPEVYCDQHPEDKADFYAFKTKAIMCQKCAETGFAHMEGGLGDVQGVELLSKTNLSLIMLERMRQDIEKQVIKLKKFQKKEVKMTQTEFFKMMNEVTLVVNPYLIVREEPQVELKFPPTLRQNTLKIPYQLNPAVDKWFKPDHFL